MTMWQVIVLGAVAGFTIFLGLPVARLRRRPSGVQSMLNALALGVLLFLVWDILAKALDRLGDALKEAIKSGHWGAFTALAFMLVVGLVGGMVGLVSFHHKVLRRSTGTPRFPRQLAVMIAIGLGLHNFSEGLAIAQAATTGAIGFAAILIIGFGLHNITEGFAIAAPLVVGGQVPTWSFLGWTGLIAGGPTLLGTIVGYGVNSPLAFVLFLALAAGALFYLIGEMFAVGRSLQRPVWSAWGVVIGFLVAYGTDVVLTVAGL